MTPPFQPRGNELLFMRLFRLISGNNQRAELARIAKEICLQLPNELFTELEGFYEDDAEEEDSDTKIGALLKETLPSWHEVAQHVGDYYWDMLDRALGNDLADWSAILGGWSGDDNDESLIDSLIESVRFYSDLYPGFKPDWDTDAVQDFLYDWRSRFFDRLIFLAESKGLGARIRVDPNNSLTDCEAVKQQLTLTTFSDCSTHLRTIKTIR